jgi:hypothetical protein
MLTIIDNPNAPTEYNYDVTLPDGGYITVGNDGSAIIIGYDQEPVAMVSAPWAKDANGKVIETYFTTDGSTLTQHIIHNVEGVIYPVTADPSVAWNWSGIGVYLNRRETNTAMFRAGGIAAISAIVPTFATHLVSAALGLYTAYANWAYNNGACMVYYITFWGGLYPGHYYGGYCR